MSSFTDSEKIQYALKYALNVTMQNKSLSSYAEERAPKRIFPSNIMSKELIEKDAGDLDTNGNYLQGHVFNPNGVLTVAADMSNYGFLDKVKDELRTLHAEDEASGKSHGTGDA